MRHLPLLKVISAIVITSFVSLFSQLIGAQTYPDRPLGLITPFPADGAVDIVARGGNADRRARSEAGKLI